MLGDDWDLYRLRVKGIVNASVAGEQERLMNLFWSGCTT